MYGPLPFQLDFFTEMPDLVPLARYLYENVCICTYMYVHVCICMYIYVYIYMHIYAHDLECIQIYNSQMISYI